jgi:dTDP-4-dehydrorhamnose 3,5-epimerase
MIDGVKVKKLKVIPDERGRVCEILRADDDVFRKFGQAYVTTGFPGVVKAWHSHKLQTDYLTCVSGMMKLVLYDARKDSPTRGEVSEFFVGVHNPLLVVIPPGVMHGFKTISETEAVVINFPTECYNPAAPDEYRVEAHSKDIPYDWARKDR